MTEFILEKCSQKFNISCVRDASKTIEKAHAEISPTHNSLTPADFFTTVTKFSPSTSFSEDSLHKNFVEYGRNAKEWLRKCALILPEIDRQQIWKKKGFSSIFEYAGKLAGMSKSSVEDALRIMKKVEDKPALRKVIEEKGIQSVKPVIAIATSETADFWAEKARIMSKNTLETYVHEYRLERLPRTPAVSEKQITMPLSPDVAAELEKLKGKGDWNTLMRELLQLRKEKLEAEKPQSVETPSRHIPVKVKNFAVAKTRGQCAYPGCKKSYKILHHTQRFALDQVHDPDHLVPLCEAHEHLAHHGLIANEDLAPEEWGILLEPEWWDLKQVVDERVQEHRGK
ncbi:MAG: hypothetical protein WC882_00505 [Candidatus Gracilibacteria bacterium]